MIFKRYHDFLKKAISLSFYIRKINNLLLSQTIKRQIRSARKSNQPCIFILATPCHTNLGDHAIVLAERALILDAQKDACIVEITNETYTSSGYIIQRHIQPHDTIVIDGGGNLGTLWENEDDKISRLISTYKKNKIVIFPQTCYYADDEAAYQRLLCNQQIYNQASNLTITLRDKASYDFVTKHFPSVKAHFTPDIVLYLDKHRYEYQREGVLICLRKDKETMVSEDLLTSLQNLLENSSIPFRRTDTHHHTDVDMESRQEALMSKFEEFAHAKLVITDRLHGMIFAAITGTPCLALDNISRKVNGVYHWIKHLDHIKMCQNEQELLGLVLEFSQKQATHYSKERLLTSFQPLIDEF